VTDKTVADKTECCSYEPVELLDTARL